MDIFLLQEIRGFAGIACLIFLLIMMLGVGMYYNTKVDKSWRPKFDRAWFLVAPALGLFFFFSMMYGIDSLKEYLIKKEINDEIIKMDMNLNAHVYINDTIQPSLKNNLITIFNYVEFENHNRAASNSEIIIKYKSKNDSLLLNLYQVGRDKNLYWVIYPKYKDDGRIGYIKTDLFEKLKYSKPYN